MTRQVDTRFESPGAFKRPDLDRKTLLGLALGSGCLMVGIMFFAGGQKPGVPLRQSAAIIGSALLLLPLLFAVVKRAGRSASPPAWFVVHVVGASFGAPLVFFHAAGGAWLSPASVLLVLVITLVMQGFFARVWLSHGFANVFSTRVTGLQAHSSIDRKTLAMLIDRKHELLAHIDKQADEALFSPTLWHWLRHPWHCLAYTRLAADEAAVVGARASAGRTLSWWRRIHILLAGLFLFALTMHVVLATFFAGYVAGGGEVYWWHLFAWGG